MGRRTSTKVKCAFPIVDARQRIVGWTRTAPQYVGGFLRHRDAEAKLGSVVVAAFVEIEALQDAVKAGAPADWQGPWRCLGLCAPALADPNPTNRSA